MRSYDFRDVTVKPVKEPTKEKEVHYVGNKTIGCLFLALIVLLFLLK